MKKISILVLFALLTFSVTTNAQTSVSAQQKIEQANKRFINWFNSGKADSIATLYHANACITGRGCGKEFILKYYKAATGTYTMRALKTLSVTVKENIATENGQWRIELSNGVELSGKYISEWQRVNKEWVILKETNLD